MSDLRFNIDVRVNSRSIVALRGFTLRKGGITFLLGESGIGKTLAARALFGLLDPDEFTVKINGLGYRTYLEQSELRSMQRDGFFVFQEPSSHLNPLMTVRQQLEEADLTGATDPAVSLGELWHAEAARDAVLIADLYPRPHRPSGGEKQRILLAMALRKMDLVRDGGLEPGVFIFDEPTGSLDNPYRDLFIASLLSRFRHRRHTILFITHDYSLISHVLSEHRDLARVMDFRELVWEDEGLKIREFRPGLYSEWIQSLKRNRPDGTRSSSSEPRLHLEGTLRILGRELLITSDPEGRLPCALNVNAGRMVYLKAPSGTGKTSLAKAVMGLIPADRMRATVAGHPLTEATPHQVWHSLWGKALTMVFQHADEALNMHSSVAQTLAQLHAPGGSGRKEITTALELLFDPAKVRSLVKRKVWMLSGGQKQRLNLVRGLMLGTDLLFIDEPLNGLDFESSTRVVAVIQHKLKEGQGVVAISHNEEIFDALVREQDRYYLHAV